MTGNVRHLIVVCLMTITFGATANESIERENSVPGATFSKALKKKVRAYTTSGPEAFIKQYSNETQQQNKRQSEHETLFNKALPHQFTASAN